MGRGGKLNVHPVVWFATAIAVAVLMYIVWLYNHVRDSKERKYRLDGRGEIVHSVTFSPDGRALATGDDSNRVRLWDMGSGLLARTFEGHSMQSTA